MNDSNSTILKLSTPEQWSEKWSSKSDESIQFDPSRPSFLDFHNLFMRYLPSNKEMKFIEIGCYPGKHMWYFNHYFEYQVFGMEYLEWASMRTEELLKANNIDAEVINADLFEFNPQQADHLWDVVMSAGLIEHFDDTIEVVSRHANLLKNHGYLILTAPNHSGLYGLIMKWLDPEMHKIHNLMDYRQLKNAIDQLEELKIVEGGYSGRLGFWATTLYERLFKLGPISYKILRLPFWIVEKIGSFFPNSHFFSPYIVVIAQKRVV